MITVYVILCDVWNGTDYGTEVVGVYENKDKAEQDAVVFQGKTPKADTNYYVVRSEFIGE